MALSKYANKKDYNQPEIVKALEDLGCDIIVLDKPTDLLVGFKGNNYLIEIKMPTKKGWKDEFTPAQKDFHGLNKLAADKEWRGQKAVVYTIDEAIAVCSYKIKGEDYERR